GAAEIAERGLVAIRWSPRLRQRAGTADGAVRGDPRSARTDLAADRKGPARPAALDVARMVAVSGPGSRSAPFRADVLISNHFVITNHESRIPNPESRITNPESRIPSHESRIPNPEPRIPNPESRITDRA